MQPTDTPVLVIGAGPAGLATAGSLAQRGVRPKVIEAGPSVATAWHGHYRRLHLHTVKELSALPHLPFPAHYPRYVPRAQVAEYLEGYARHFRLQPHCNETAVAIRREGARWRTACRGGRDFVSDAVVVATGANQVPNEPSFDGQAAFSGSVLHSRHYLEPAPFAGQRVLVVGMGNTGAEIAMDLAQHGVDVTLSVRSPVNVVLRDVMGRPTQRTAIALSKLPPRIAYALSRKLCDWTVGDLRPWGLRTPRLSPLEQLRLEGRTPVIDIGTLDLVRAGRIAVRPGIAGFTPDGVRFADGRGDPFDTVILATGYRPDVQRLFPDVPVPLDDRGLPRDVLPGAPLDGIAFVGFDIRQPGGLLRTIAQQAESVAAALAPRAAGSVRRQPGAIQRAP